MASDKSVSLAILLVVNFTFPVTALHTVTDQTSEFFFAEPMHRPGVGPLQRPVPGDDARGGRRRGSQPDGVRHLQGPMEPLHRLRPWLRQAHGLQPFVPTVRVQEEPRRQRLRPLHHLARLQGHPRMLRRQLPQDYTGFLNLKFQQFSDKGMDSVREVTRSNLVAEPPVHIIHIFGVHE